MALVDYHAGIVHLSSFDGTLLAIPEGELCREDLNYVRSQDVYKMGKHDVTPCLFRFPVHSLTSFGTGPAAWYVPSPSAHRHFS